MGLRIIGAQLQRFPELLDRFGLPVHGSESYTKQVKRFRVVRTIRYGQAALIGSMQPIQPFRWCSNQ
jgi:hypothetical protein